MVEHLPCKLVVKGSIPFLGSESVEREMNEHTGSSFDQYIELLSNPAHWAFEITLIVLIDIILLGVAWPIIKKMIRRHDNVVHGHDH